MAQFGTTLEYPAVFARGERRVKVTGEAMFVKSDPRHPFVVETFACDVRVLGTKFNAEANEEGDFQRRPAPRQGSGLQPDGPQRPDYDGADLDGPSGKKEVAASCRRRTPTNCSGRTASSALNRNDVRGGHGQVRRCYDINVEILRDDLPQIEFQRCKLRISEG
ncbi:MAG: hypothetical protein ACLRM8_02130 [Alistipes sp.]